MRDPLQKVKQGDAVQIGATVWNRFIDAANAELQSRGESNTPREGFGAGAATILIRNTTGDTLGWYSVVAIDDADSTFDPSESDDLELSFQQQVVLDGLTPTDADQQFAVMLEPLEDDDTAIGLAVVAGAVQVQVDVTDEDHQYATTISGDTEKLTSQDSGGARILSKPAGTGVLWCVVMLPIAASAGTIFSGAAVLRSTFTTLTGASNTTLTYDTENFDTDGYHENATHPTRLTIPTAGYYSIGTCVEFAGNGTAGVVQVQLLLNGATQQAFWGNTISALYSFTCNLTFLGHYSAGDYLELVVGNATAANQIVQAVNKAQFWIKREG